MLFVLDVLWLGPCLGHAYVDYDDEGLAIQLADAKCDTKKDPFRGRAFCKPSGCQGGNLQSQSRSFQLPTFETSNPDNPTMTFSEV